jgi:hypothetical protein
MAVPYLLSFGWGQRYKIKNTSHKKWYKLLKEKEDIFGGDGVAGLAIIAEEPFSDSFTHYKRLHLPVASALPDERIVGVCTEDDGLHRDKNGRVGFGLGDDGLKVKPWIEGPMRIG